MTKEEKAEDYDRLQYEFTQINQELKSEKRKNKKLTKQFSLTDVVKPLKDEEVIPFEDWRKENCTHLDGDLYSFKQNVFDSYDLRCIYMRERKQSL